MNCSVNRNFSELGENAAALMSADRYLTSLPQYSIICNTNYTCRKNVMLMKGKRRGNKYMGSVKVGPKGQIVIPKEVREMFGIAPGDALVLLADSDRGIAIERYSIFSGIADAIFAGRARDIYPDVPEEDSRQFAAAIREMGEEA